jgi:hypothetical protein
MSDTNQANSRLASVGEANMYVDLYCIILYFSGVIGYGRTFTNTSDTAENAMTLWRPLTTIRRISGFGLEMDTVNQYYQAKIGELGIVKLEVESWFMFSNLFVF